MEPYGIIFLTENLVTGDTYIGQTSRKNRRDYYLGSGLHLRRAIKKYGRSNFEKQVLCECDSQEQLDRRERLYITLLCPVYNIDLGGRGRGKTSEETRIKLRLAKLGTKHTPEYRAALSAKTKGRILTEEHKRKLQALAESKKGKPLSLEARARMSAAKKRKTFLTKESRGY